MEEAHSVLLADDHPIVLSGLKALLGSRADFQVVAACSDGAEALHCLRELEPYLGVLDIHMPGLSGIEVLKITESEGLRTRIVFLTASATDKNVTEAVSGGAWGIVLKDIAAHELIDCLKKVAAGETTHAGTTWTTTMAAAAVPGSWFEAATPWLPCVVMVASPCVPVWMRRLCFWSVCAPHRREQALRQARAAPRLHLGKFTARVT